VKNEQGMHGFNKCQSVPERLGVAIVFSAISDAILARRSVGRLSKT
jgi:hypothetical protein